MKYFLLFSILFSFSAHSRTLIQFPESTIETINLSEARSLIDKSKLKNENKTQAGWLAIDVTNGIHSREVKSAQIGLFANDYEITHFGVSVYEVSGAEGTQQLVSFPVNPNVVTHLTIRFYCSENYIFDLEIALDDL